VAGKDRKRQIARERYERRMQARAAARAKQRQRWTVGGAAAAVVAIVAIVLALTLPGNHKSAASGSPPVATDSGDASSGDAASSPPASPTPPVPTSAPGCTSTPTPVASLAPNFPILPGGLDPALRTEPTVTVPAGPVPITVQTKDLIVGSGDTVKADDTVTLNYVGLNYVDCKEFDSSWSSGQYLTLPVNQFVPGFTQGVTGMKVGGRREIIIPPSQGYGATGSSPAIQPNEELVFVVDVIAATHASPSASAPTSPSASTPPATGGPSSAPAS